MTLGAADFALYAGALFVLFATPGPVWLAMAARALSGGFAGAWPLAFGVAAGDVVWPLLAVLGVSWIASELESFLGVLRWVACAIFVWLGILAIRHAEVKIPANSRLTRPGVRAGFFAGLAVILGNPKAILFYMGVLPGFFDLGGITVGDIVAIAAISAAVPLFGNLALGLFIDRMRRTVTSPGSLARINRIAGWLLICVGAILPFT